MCSSFRLPTKAADRRRSSWPRRRWSAPGCSRGPGFHEFQYRPCSLTSKPDSIAACDGSVDARRMVRALQRVGGALHDRLVHRRADAHQRVGAQAVLADDHDVADRGASRSAARSPRRARRRRRRRGPAAPAAAGGAPVVGACGGSRRRPRAARSASRHGDAVVRTVGERIRRPCSVFQFALTLRHPNVPCPSPGASRPAPAPFARLSFPVPP